MALEFDGSAKVNSHLSFYGATAFTDGKYVSFPDAPPPLEDTGGPQVKDVSGSSLPGISKAAISFGGEYIHPASVLGRTGEIFGAVRHQLSLLVFVERERLAVSGDRRLLAAQCARRLPMGGRLVAFALVAQPVRRASTSSCCRPRLATPVSMWGCPETENVGVTMR